MLRKATTLPALHALFGRVAAVVFSAIVLAPVATGEVAPRAETIEVEDETEVSSELFEASRFLKAGGQPPPAPTQGKRPAATAGATAAPIRMPLARVVATTRPSAATDGQDSSLALLTSVWPQGPPQH